MHLGRKGLIARLDSHVTKIKVYSLPLINFIDGFGLYRNMYRSIIGFYFTLAGLLYKERMWRTNVIPFTLGPHGI